MSGIVRKSPRVPRELAGLASRGISPRALNSERDGSALSARGIFQEGRLDREILLRRGSAAKEDRERELADGAIKKRSVRPHAPE